MPRPPRVHRQTPGPTPLIHLAAIAVPFSAPEDVILRTNAALALNVGARRAVAAASRRSSPASSPTVLGYGAPAGWLPERLPLDEEAPALPWNAYALSKLLVEQVIAMLARQTGDRLRFAAFRPCYVIAPEEWQGAPTQQGHTVRERLDDPALSAPALFNYVDARDVATFRRPSWRSSATSPTARCSSSAPTTPWPASRSRACCPRFLPGSRGLAAGLTGTSPAFSIAKAQAMLGWRPRRSPGGPSSPGARKRCPRHRSSARAWRRADGAENHRADHPAADRAAAAQLGSGCAGEPRDRHPRHTDDGETGTGFSWTPHDRTAGRQGPARP